MIKNITVFSKVLFDKFCKTHQYNDANIENINDTAFISIIGTENCQKYYLNEIEEHYFKYNHPNVLNIEFDDIDANMMYKGYWFLTLSKLQAKELFNFIENNIEKNFVIHCRAGMSRSGAIGTFIYNMYKEQFELNVVNSRNGKTTPNINVLTLLKEEYYNKYGWPFDENNEIKK